MLVRPVKQLELYSKGFAQLLEDNALSKKDIDDQICDIEYFVKKIKMVASRVK